MTPGDQHVLVTTLEAPPGYRVAEILGIVSASAVVATHIGRDILAGLRNIVGGEIREYTELMEKGRRLALARLVEKARSMGANAVLAARFTSTAIAGGAAEILVYGTAARVEKTGGGDR